MKLSLTWVTHLNWSSAKMGFPFFHEFTLSDIPPDIRGLRIQITAAVSGLEIFSASADLDQPNREKQDCIPEFRWQWEHCLPLIENETPADADFSLRLLQRTSGEYRTLEEFKALPLKILSPCHWDSGIRFDGEKFGLAKRAPCFQMLATIGPASFPSVSEIEKDLHAGQSESLALSIASLCVPAHPHVKSLCEEVAKNLAAVRNGSPISALQNSDYREALFVALHRHMVRNFLYSAEPVSYQKSGSVNLQRIRLPEEFGPGKAATLTCIDMAAIAAAACENWLLNPVLIIYAGQSSLHAVTGIPKSCGQAIGTGKRMFRSASELSQEFTILDFTAEDETRAVIHPSRFDGCGFFLAIDIAAIRGDGFAPLPLNLPRIGLIEALFPRNYAQIAKPVPIPSGPFETSDPGFSEKVFVDVDCRNHLIPDEAPRNALAYISRMLAGQMPARIAILAQPGAGKSYLLARAFRMRLDAWAQSPRSARMPIFYSLARYRSREPLFKQILEQLNAQGYPHRDLAEFRGKAEAGAFSFFLDALDEMPVRSGADAGQLLSYLQPLLQAGKAEVVLSSRTALFQNKAARLLPGFELMELLNWDTTRAWNSIMRSENWTPWKWRV